MLVPKLSNNSHIPREYKIINVDFVIEVTLIQYLLTKAFMMTLSFVHAIIVSSSMVIFFKKKTKLFILQLYFQYILYFIRILMEF